MYHSDRYVDNKGGYACVGILETSVPSSQFCYEPKTALKNKESKIQVRGESFPLPYRKGVKISSIGHSGGKNSE